MLDLKFEKFRGGQSDRFGMSEKARATINRRGMIYLNTKMYEKMGRPASVALYFNRNEGIIAIEPAFDRSPEHFQVYKKQSGWSIHASTFCRHYRIRVPNTERFLYPRIDNEGVLHLDLRETITVGGIGRTTAKQSFAAQRAASRRQIRGFDGIAELRRTSSGIAAGKLKGLTE